MVDLNTKVAFFSITPPSDYTHLETMLGYALAAKAMDYDVMIFLALDGVLIAKKHVFECLETKVKDRIKECIGNGISIMVCSAAADAFHFEEGDLIKGAELAGIVSFYTFAEDAKIVLSWN